MRLPLWVSPLSLLPIIIITIIIVIIIFIIIISNVVFSAKALAVQQKRTTNVCVHQRVVWAIKYVQKSHQFQL